MDESTRQQPKRKLDSAFWRVCLAFTFVASCASLMNHTVFPLFDGVFTYARDISVTCGVLAFAGMGIGAARAKSARAITRLIEPVGVACLMVGSVLLIPSLTSQTAWTLVVSSSLCAIGRAAVILLVGLAAMRLDYRELSLCLALSIAFGFVFDSLVWPVPIIVGVVLFLLMPFGEVLLVRSLANESLDECAGHEPDSAQPSQLAISLPFAGRLFICLFIFSLAFGFSLRFGELGGVPASKMVALVPAVAVVAYVAIRKTAISVDRLINCAFLFIVAGFFMAATFPENATFTAAAVLSAGNALFDMAAWLVLVRIAQLNPAGAVATIAWGRGIYSLGSLAGAALGVWSNALFRADPSLLAMICGLLILAIVAFILVALRSFSFEKTIEQSAHAEAQQDESTPANENPVDRFAARCEEVSLQYSLSPRESEVLALLARGRDRTYIQEQLVISHNTVKAHVKHVYAKLGIHSQQELIALIQDDESF